MDKERVKRFRTATFIAMLIWLCAMAAMLGVLVFLMADALENADAEGRSLLGRMLWLCSSALGLTLLLLLWGVIRYIKFRLNPPVDSKATKYVDAWAEAGRRFQLPKEGGQGDNDEDA